MPPEPTTNPSLSSQADVVILTALSIEFTAVEKLLVEVKEEVHETGTVYSVGMLGDLRVAIVESGAGNASAALETERAVRRFSPRAIAFVGVAGGLKDVAIGDLVVATKVYRYESGKDAREFHPRPHAGETSYKFVQRARSESRTATCTFGGENSSQPSVFVGPIAAGEKVVSSKRSATRRLLKTSYSDALAVEMEGDGVLTAAHANENVAVLIVRGISDLLSGKRLADEGGSQHSAARNAAALALHLLKLVLGTAQAGKVAAAARLGSPPPQSSFDVEVPQASPIVPSPSPVEHFPIERVSWSPDSSFLATWNSRECDLEFWSTATRSLAFRVHVHDDPGICGVSWSTQTPKVAVAGCHKYVLLDTARRSAHFTNGSMCNYDSVRVSPDGDRVVYGTPFGMVVLTDAESGNRIRFVKYHTGIASIGVALNWSSTSERLLVRIDGRACELWDRDGNVVLAYQELATETVASIAWSKGGDEFVLSTELGHLQVCSAESGWPYECVPEDLQWNQTGGQSPQSVLVTADWVGRLHDGRMALWHRPTSLTPHNLAIGPTSSYGPCELYLSQDEQRVAVLYGATFASIRLEPEGPIVEWNVVFDDAAQPNVLGWDADGRAWIVVGRTSIAAVDSQGVCTYRSPSTITQASLSPDGHSICIANAEVMIASVRDMSTYILASTDSHRQGLAAAIHALGFGIRRESHRSAQDPSS